jgi:hypothetical protein
MIIANRPLLNAFAECLLTQEVIEREDIERLVREHREGRLTQVHEASGPEVVDGAVVRELEPGAPRLAAAESYDGDDDRPQPPDSAA